MRNSSSIHLLDRQMLSIGRSSCSLLFCSQFPRCCGPVKISIRRKCPSLFGTFPQAIIKLHTNFRPGTTTGLLRMKRTSTTLRPWRRRRRYLTSGLYFSQFSASWSPFLSSSLKRSLVLRLPSVTRRTFPSSTGASSSYSLSARSLQLWAYLSAPCSHTGAHPGISVLGRLSWSLQGSLIWRGIGDERRSAISRENHPRPSRMFLIFYYALPEYTLILAPGPM